MDLLIIRYEDLKSNFEETCQNLFRELDLPHDINLIKDTKKEIGFKVVSGGRKLGEKAEHLVRSGLIGESTSELNKIERSKVWKMASYELSLLSYKEETGALRLAWLFKIRKTMSNEFYSSSKLYLKKSVSF